MFVVLGCGCVVCNVCCVVGHIRLMTGGWDWVHVVSMCNCSTVVPTPLNTPLSTPDVSLALTLNSTLYGESVLCVCVCIVCVCLFVCLSVCMYVCVCWLVQMCLQDVLLLVAVCGMWFMV